MLWLGIAGLLSTFPPSMHSLLIVTLPLLLGAIGIVAWYGVAKLGQRIGKAQEKKAARQEQIWAAEVPSHEIRATAFPTGFSAMVFLLFSCEMYAVLVWLPDKQPTHPIWNMVLAVAFIACVLMLGWMLVWTMRLWAAYGVTSPWSRPAVRLSAEGIRYFDQVQIPWTDVLGAQVITIATRAVVNYVVLFTPHPIGTYATGETPSPKMTLLSDENKKDEFFGYLVKAPSPYFLAMQPELLAGVQPAQLRVWIEQLRLKAQGSDGSYVAPEHA